MKVGRPRSAPVSGARRQTAGEVLDVISRLNESTGSTVIMATHDPNAIERAHRKVEISDGFLR